PARRLGQQGTRCRWPLPGHRSRARGAARLPGAAAEGFESRSRAGLRLHPGVRHGAARRRRCEWEQPHNVSWRPAAAGDAEWMSGKSRARLAPALTKAPSWMSDLSTLGIWVCARRSIAPRRPRVQRRGRPISEKALVILECNEAFANGI